MQLSRKCGKEEASIKKHEDEPESAFEKSYEPPFVLCNLTRFHLLFSTLSSLR